MGARPTEFSMQYKAMLSEKRNYPLCLGRVSSRSHLRLSLLYGLRGLRGLRGGDLGSGLWRGDLGRSKKSREHGEDIPLLGG